MRIKLLLLDVDGTLTDGKITYLSSGEEIKSFHVRDGLGINALQNNGIRVGIITGRKSTIVERRANELGITILYQGVKNKCEALSKILDEYQYHIHEVAYMGDDVNDLEIMSMVGYSACPKNACAEVREIATFISKFEGGNGAVREFSDYLLKDHDWKHNHNNYFKQ